MSCLDDAVLARFLDGELTGDELTAVRAHLDLCPACRRLAAQLMSTTGEQEAPPSARPERRDLVDLPTQAPRTSLARPSRWSTIGPAAPDELASIRGGETVDHYRVLRRIGQGGMGEVYLARDTRLGRRVALKVIHPRWVRSTHAADQLLHEARATARFNHAHIITIYGVGEYQGRPYVALEHLEGRNLHQHLAEGPLGPLETARIGLAVAQALAVAHGAGILHRDLKPSNIILPRDGRVRVLDFGLATAMEERVGVETSVAAHWPIDATDGNPESSAMNTEIGSGALCGTPLYIAPERWAGQPASGAADIWSLGLVLCEMLAGVHPFAGASIDEVRALVLTAEPVLLPEVEHVSSLELVALIERCLDKDPQRRPAAAQIAERLEVLLRTAPGRQRSLEQSPFRGLFPFSESQAAFFFGREREVAAAVERLREQPFLAIIGPSGTGKTSFVQAGLLPRLREHGPLTVVRLRPGAQPLLTLATKLMGEGSTHPAMSEPSHDDANERPSAAGTAPAARGGQAADAPLRPAAEDAGRSALAAAIHHHPQLLGMKLRELADANCCDVLLHVDQLEEVFTLVEQEVERRRFIEALCAAADDAADPVRVVVTLRDEFFYRLAAVATELESLGTVVTLSAPDDAMLAAMLVKPVEALGCRYDDPSLVEEMVAAVRGEVACLPLLQFGARQLWEHRDRERRLLLRSSYELLGGLGGALARHAETLLSSFGADERELARRILLRLVTPEGTRRVLPRQAALEGLAGAAEAVVERLLAERLLVQHLSVVTGEPELELAHEALLTAWDRLARWMEESHAERQTLDEVQRAAELWERRGHREDELWSDEALREGLRALQRCQADVRESARRFLVAGQRRARRHALARKLRVGGAIGLLCLLALAATAVALVLSRQNRAIETQRALAVQRQADALIGGARSALLRGRFLDARAQLRLALEARDSETGRMLWWQLERNPLVWSSQLAGRAYNVALSADGRIVAAGTMAHNTYVLDATTGHKVRILQGEVDGILCLALSPDGTTLATGGKRGGIWLWDLRSFSGERIAQEHSNMVNGMAFSPDGAWLVSVGEDGRIALWDVRRRRTVRTFDDNGGGVSAVAISPRSDRLASGGVDSAIRIRSLPDGQLVRTLTGHAGRIFELRYAPDGKLLASAGLDRTIRLWDPQTGAARAVLRGHSHTVLGLSIAPDGRRLASGSFDGTIRIWNASSGRVERTFTPGDRVLRVAFTPAGDTLASTHWDETLRLWDLSSADTSEQQQGHSSFIQGLTFSRDGARVVTGSGDRTARLWETATGRLLRTVTDNRSIPAVLLSGDGKALYTGTNEASVSRWDLRTGARLDTLWNPTRSAVNDLALSPDGKLLAMVGNEPQVRLWETAGNTLRRTLEGHGPGILRRVAFSADGRLLVSGGDDRVARLWDVASGRGVGTLEVSETVAGLAFSPDGRTVAVGSVNGELVLWTAATGERRQLAKLSSPIFDLAYHPDGRRLGVALAKGGPQLIELATGKRVALYGHREEVLRIRFSPDGRLVATTGGDHTLRLWDATSGQPSWHAPLLAPASARLYTRHRGWLSLVSDKAPAGEPKWQRALQNAKYAELSPPPASKLLCSQTFDGTLEVWDAASGVRLRARAVPGIARVLALADGCLVLDDRGRVAIDRRAGPSVTFAAGGASAVAWSGDRGFVAEKGRVLVLSAEGARLGSLPSVGTVTAMDAEGDRLLLGTAAGSIEVVSIRSGQRLEGTNFEDLPEKEVTRLRWISREQFVAAYVTGEVGIWSLVGGRRLAQAQLHGPVTHLLRHRGYVVMATELGSSVAWDLRVLGQPYCALLRQIWRRVPFIWRAGALRRQPPPHDLRCTAAPAGR